MIRILTVSFLVARLACRRLDDLSRNPDEKPWVLFVSFVCPHPPYVAPPELFEKYVNVDIPMPTQSKQDEWPKHPVFDEFIHHIALALPDTFKVGFIIANGHMVIRKRCGNPGSIVCQIPGEPHHKRSDQ